MATAKKQAQKAASRRRFGWPKILLILLVLVAGLLLYLRETMMEQAFAGAAYGARIACSCRHVGGRSLDDCRKDFEPGMALVRLSEDEAAKSVTASVPLLASQSAIFREGRGCLLERWDR